MTGEQMVALARKHTIFEWAAQATVDPVPVAYAKGVYFWTPEGKRFLDFNSQLMCVNIGHGDDRVIDAMYEQARKLAYISPHMATEPRARLGEKLAAIAPGDINTFFFTTGGAEANENAIRIARLYTGRHKILARYRSYHGATAGAITLSGDPRRWDAGPGMAGVVHVASPYHGVGRGWDSVDHALATLDEVIQLEGPGSIAAFILEPVTGSNGILVPPDGYLQGVRELCTKYRILMIADEVMSGCGRTGEWFAVNHWNVVPDLLTMAKGLTSWYVPFGAVGMREHVAEFFNERVFSGGLTSNSHPVACAVALACLAVYELDGLIDNARRLGVVMQALLDKLAVHVSVGAVRSIGLFGALELVRNRRTLEPMAPFNSTSPEMEALAKFFREEGLYTLMRWHTVFTIPPLCITERQLRDGFEIVDEGLRMMDRAVE